MSVRQDNENKNSRNRGLGIAAAAIGVGVGAALYYYFSKREEPDTEGATTSGWNSEPLFDSYSTISEHSTTDTSMNSSVSNETNSLDTSTTSESCLESENSSIESQNSSIESQNSSLESQNSSSESSESDCDSVVVLSDSDDSVMELDSSQDILISDQTISDLNTSVDSETEPEWDVVSGWNSTTDYTTNFSMAFIHGMMLDIMLPFRPKTRRQREAETRAKKSEKVFRERTWVPEECAICFDMMNTQQNVMALPCTHRFHQDCILCWLQEKQTCPVCRKSA